MVARCLVLFLLAGCSQESSSPPGQSKQSAPPPTVERKATPALAPRNTPACTTVVAAPLDFGQGDTSWVGVAIAEDINRRLFARKNLSSYTSRQVAAAMREARVLTADLRAPAAVQELGRHLGACFLLVGQGSIDAQKIRGTALVIEVADGKTRASVKLDAPLADLAKVEDLIAEQLASVIGGPLSRGPKDPSATTSIEVIADTTRALMLLRGQSLSPRAANPAAFLAISTKHQEQAKKLASAAVKKDPKYADAWAVLGLADAVGGNTRLAWKRFRRATILLPSGRSLTILAQCFTHMREGRFLAAEKFLRATVTAHPGFLHARGTLAELMIHFGRLPEARDVLSKYLKRAPNQPWVLAKIARIDAMQGKTDLALAGTLKAVSLVPKSSYLLTELASRQIDANDLKAAHQTLQQVLQIAPEQVRALVRLGYVQLRRGADKAAIETCQKAIGLATKSRHRRERAYAHLNLARAFGHLKQVDQALEHLENAVGEPGISLDQIERDPLLENLRKDPRYQILVQPAPSAGTFTID